MGWLFNKPHYENIANAIGPLMDKLCDRPDIMRAIRRFIHGQLVETKTLKLMRINHCQNDHLKVNTPSMYSQEIMMSVMQFVPLSSKETVLTIHQSIPKIWSCWFKHCLFNFPDYITESGQNMAKNVMYSIYSYVHSNLLPPMGVHICSFESTSWTEDYDGKVEQFNKLCKLLGCTDTVSYNSLEHEDFLKYD
jgi:hypothetical protein